MKKVLFFIIIFSVTSFADVEERRDKILKLIDSEVQEISRLVKQTRGSNPNFILRLSELYFEQARLLHERELDRFKNLSSEQKDAIDKRSFYAESRNKFENAQKTAKFLLKNYPRYPQKGDVYYILAKNSMEFQDTKSASEYFTKAYSNAGANDELKEKAGVSMAENYYNNKKYAQAIPLYEKALVGKKDKWWTKDAYNLAWCYYRTHNY
ncbi:MAG: tetratricopeptide repeat protein, partial [Bacteriovoracales bacterium]